MTGRSKPPHSPPASHLPCLAGRRNPSEKPGRGRLCRLGFKGIEFQHRCSQCTTTLTWQLPNDSKLECVCVCACVVERMHVYLSSRGTTRHDERYSLPIRSPCHPSYPHPALKLSLSCYLLSLSLYVVMLAGVTEKRWSLRQSWGSDLSKRIISSS